MEGSKVNHQLDQALQSAHDLASGLSASISAAAQANPLLAMVLRDQLEATNQIRQRLCEVLAVCKQTLPAVPEENTHGQ